MYQYILFDLDGTLTDPQEGITKCIYYALEAFDMAPQSLEELKKHIGPPLSVTFHGYYQMNEEDTKRAIEKYRERFSEVGLFENKVFPGIIPMLSRLKEQGKKLGVATSKPETYTLRILEKFQLLPYFDVICGSTLDGSREAKADVIEEALRRFKLTHQDVGNVIMVGDRKQDIIGAKKCRLHSIGVEFGFAEKGELKEAGADYIVDTVEELEHLILSL